MVINALSDNVELGTTPSTARIAVIDIGSNSVRLVIYGKNGAYPAPLFDERSNCQLGAGLDSSGILAADRIEAALLTLKRFAAIIHTMKVDACYPVATAAVRRARNGDDFKIPAEAILGCDIHLLSQQEEAVHVSRGLTLNVPEASGLVADLGGGSIEIVALEKGVIQHTASLNYGHLSNASEAEIIAAISDIDWLENFQDKQLFGVGGSFRALGSAYFEREKYPLKVLHGARISAEKVLGLCDDFTSTSPSLKGVPAARQNTMPMAARIIRALMAASGVRRVIISGTSIRDGVVAVNELNDVQRADFLVAISSEISSATGRFEGVSDALKNFLQPLALGNGAKFLRLVDVACNLADICWNEHSDFRGDIAERRVLRLPVNCMTHGERVWLSVVLYHRYEGLKQAKSKPDALRALLSKKRQAEAVTVGLGLRFALNFSAGTRDFLDKIHLEYTAQNLILHVDPAAADLLDNHSRRRFTAFAESANLTAEFIIG